MSQKFLLGAQSGSGCNHLSHMNNPDYHQPILDLSFIGLDKLMLRSSDPISILKKQPTVCGVCSLVLRRGDTKL